MATKYHNLSSYDASTVPSAKMMRFGIVCSEWNSDITYAMRDGAIATLIEHGAAEDDIDIVMVPGSFELIYGSQMMANTEQYDAIIAIGCVVRGDTPHFDYVCSGTTYGLAHLNATQKTPVIFSLLTTDTMEQAQSRAGGKDGNKGIEGAITAIKMAANRLG